jgi:Phosphotransferase enzyme family
VTLGLGKLTSRQRELLGLWLPNAEIVKDHSWGLVGTAVLEAVAPDGARYVVKAGGESDGHIAREVYAHRRWLEPLTALGRAPVLVHADEGAKLLVTRFLAGRLVEGSDEEHLSGTYRQAGELLARYHGQLAQKDSGSFERRQKEKALAWLGRPHRIAPDVADSLAALIEQWPMPPATLVPTHGDWQPRNWLMHQGTVRVIDFGRADLRPALTDFGRLAAQQFRTDANLEAAFLEGYGTDPREPGAWLRVRVQEAVGTAAWAYQVGDESFERQGHRMIAELAAELGLHPASGAAAKASPSEPTVTSG